MTNLGNTAIAITSIGSDEGLGVGDWGLGIGDWGLGMDIAHW